MMSASLRQKILRLTMGLVITSAIMISVAVLISASSAVKYQTREQLLVGERVFDRLLEDHVVQLLESASVLVDDFGFKQAVTSKDQPTIESALENLGERINADLIALLNINGELISQLAQIDLIDRVNLMNALSLLDHHAEFSDIALLDSRIYQLVVIPVKAPKTVAWVVIGLEIDRSFAQQLKEITNLEVGFGQGSNKVTQVEVLLRWIHDDFGFISPEEFITLAE